MNKQAGRSYESNDDIQTPRPLARAAVQHFAPRGRMLDPCRGDGAFYDAMREWEKEIDPQAAVFGYSNVEWCEIKHGTNFYNWNLGADWIMTNPPWSQLKEPYESQRHDGWQKSFMRHAFNIADNVVFLLTVNHATGLKVRRQWAKDYKMGIYQIVEIDTPPLPWPQSGFQVAFVHWKRGYTGPTFHFDWTGRKFDE